MRVIERSVNLNEMCRVENLSGVAFTGESGHQFVITGFAGNEPVFFEGGIAGQFRCPDGTPIEFTPSYTDIDSDGRAVVTLPDNCYLHGSGPFGIIITNVINEKPGVIYAAAGFMQTGESASPVDPENVVNVDAIVDIISDMYTAIAACAEATEYIPDVIAPEYNPLSTYAIGDWVSAYDQDNGWGLYWCNTPITTAGTGWGTNKTKFTKITVGKQITDTRISADGVLTLNLNGYQTINCTISSTATLTASGTTYQSKKIPRNLMWDTVKITANSTGATYATFFTGAFPTTITTGADVSGALATGETGRHEIATGTTVEFKIPADAAYIIVTVKSTSNRTPESVVVSTAVNNMSVTAKATADDAIAKDEDTKNALYHYPDSIEKATGIAPYLFYAGHWTTPAVGSESERRTGAGWVCSRFPVETGDKITLCADGYTGVQRRSAFLDADGNILSREEADQTGTATLTAPDSSAYMIINNRLSTRADGYYAYKGEAIGTQLSALSDAAEKADEHIGAAETAIGWAKEQIYPAVDESYYWNAETATAVKTAFQTYRAYAPVAVLPGERYSVYGYDANSQKQYMVLVVDNAYTILAHYGERDNNHREYTFTIPENGAYVLLDTTLQQYVYIYKLVLNDLAPSGAGMYKYAGKNIAIIGDSISTNGHWSAENPYGNTPEIIVQSEDVGVTLSAYVTFRDVWNNSAGTVPTNKAIGGHTFTVDEIGTEVSFVPTSEDIGKTVGVPNNNNAADVIVWWEAAQEALGFNAIPVCWSGASVSSHEGNSASYKASYAWHPSQIRKCGIRTPGTMNRTAPDMIIIYRGTNDFSHTPYSVLTDNYFGSSWAYPETDVLGTNTYGFKEGLCLTIRKLREAYPSAVIVLCTCNFFKRVNFSTYPVNNGSYTENQLNNAIREVADWMGCKLIEFDKDGLTFENASSVYYQDASAFTHPTTAGHKILANRAMRDMLGFNDIV